MIWNTDKFDVEYLKGFEDALELLKQRLMEKNIEIPQEIMDEIEEVITTVKEGRIEMIRKELGILQ